MRKWARHHYSALLDVARRTQHRVEQSPRRSSLLGALFTTSLLLLINARRLRLLVRARLLRAHPERSPRFAATIWYEQMTRLLARRGWRKSPSQTPVEFAKAIEDGLLRERVAQFTRHYESARFGDSAEDACRLPELYEEITAHC